MWERLGGKFVCYRKFIQLNIQQCVCQFEKPKKIQHVHSLGLICKEPSKSIFRGNLMHNTSFPQEDHLKLGLLCTYTILNAI